MVLAYEKWQSAVDVNTASPVFRALHEARLDSFLADSQDDGVMVIDASGTIIDCNLALSRRTGFGRAEIIGRPMEEVIEPAQRRRIRAAIDDALTGDGVRARAVGVKRSGATCDLAITFIPLFDEQRAVVGALAITQNLSEASDAERDRQRDGALLELASRIAGFVGWTLDLTEGSVVWSGDLPELRGHMPTTLDALDALLDASEAARLARALERCRRGGHVLDITLAVRAGAIERHLRLVGRVASVDDRGSQRALQVSGAAYDVTASVIEQRQRELAEELLLRTVNALTDGFAVLDADWRVEFVNDRMLEIAELDRSSIVGATIWQLLPNIEGSDFERALRQAVEQRTTVHVRGWSTEWERWLEAIAYSSGDGLAVHLRDITEVETARQAYEEAQEQLARLGGLLDISRDAIVVRDLQHRIRYANAGAIALYGWQEGTVVGRDAATLLDLDNERRDEATAAVVQHGHWSGRITVRTHDGRELVLASRWQLLRDDTGAPESILSVAVDVTEEVARDEAVRRAERLESLGSFASGIAHDLNNVLTPITLASQLLRQLLAGTPEAETAEMIEVAARRGSNMVRQVLTFARGVERGADQVDVTALLGELERMVADGLKPGVTLTINPPPPFTTVVGDGTQLLQVLSNLVANANDAISGDGTIAVDARVELGSELEQPTLVIDIVDSGHGMSQDVIARLWEPFFTTKPVGKGTGLGLPMVAAIVRAHGGTIDVDSDGRSGSRFTISIPASVGSTPTAGVPSDPVVISGAGRAVLIVDDEQAIRVLVGQILEERGFRVMTASNGVEAHTLLRGDGPHPDVVLSDITMPGGDGIALVRAMIDDGLPIPVVLMSGRDDAVSLPADVRGRHAGFLVKPLMAPALLTAIANALRATSRGDQP